MKYSDLFESKEGNLYHGTSTLYVDDILKNGLGDPSHWGTKEVAIGFAKDKCRTKGGKPVLISVPIHEFDQWHFEIDENMIDFPIYPDVEARWKKWEKSSKDWKASLKIYGAVVYDSPMYLSTDDFQNILESASANDSDYNYHVYVYLQSMANRHRSTNMGAAIFYRKSIATDRTDIENYYEETIVPYLERYNYPKAPDGPGDQGETSFYEMVDEIVKDWSTVSKPQ